RTVPRSTITGGLTSHQRDRRLVRQILTGAGASEAWTTTFVAPAELVRRGPRLEPARRRGVAAPHVAAARPPPLARLQRGAPRARRVAVRDRQRLPPAGQPLAGRARARRRRPRGCRRTNGGGRLARPRRGPARPRVAARGRHRARPA